ncbi:MAG TPA: CarD family transcriptional regulator, partial [Candidatus Cloacimonadota bacterium]|nr:CarD family transcriptional regulator [Candidatus Cloacimonadota bacterium]
MLYQKIAAQLEQSAFFRDLIPIAAGTQIYHLSQSARALVAAHLWAKSGKNLILVSQDDIIAEDLWDDLVSLVGRENAFYLPDYEILPYEDRSPHYSIRATRMITLLNALGDAPAIYSLSVRSLLRLIPDKESLARHVLNLKQGDSINPDELLKQLHNMGYEVEYQVSKVYQAARRGGILDVFSPPNQNPVRIEFWGDEIISIRSFSASTQRSLSADIKDVTLIPAREISLDDINSGSVIISQVREHGFFEGIENYYSLLTKNLSSFVDYFPPETRIMAFSNYSYIVEEMEALQEQTYSQYRKALKSRSKAKTPAPKQLILDEEAYYKLISGSDKIYLSQSEFIFPESTANVRAPFMAQPVFESDLGLVAQTLQQKQQSGWKYYLLFDNPSQERRMRQTIAEDASFISHIGVLHEGFEIEDIKLGLWTDHEIFNRYKRKRYAPRFAPGETIVDYENLKPGDYVVHIDHGVGVFEGLKIIRLDGQDVECLVLRYANEDRVYVPTFQLSLVTKYVAEEGSAPVLNKLG